MRRITGLFCVILTAIGGTAVAESFLEPASFPKTINDVSFIDRLISLADGYDDFESMFDENGVCISGCAYKGIKLENMIEASERATREAAAKLELYKQRHPEEFAEDQPSPPQSSPPEQQQTLPETPPNPPVTPPQTSQPPAQNVSEYSCPTNQWSQYIPQGREIVDHAPIDTDLIVTSDIGERSVSGGSSWHQGIDLRATDGTPLYMPANGIVKAVTGGPSSSAGYYIWVYHPTEDIYTRYMHLSAQLVKTGDKIQAGCLFAKSGHSGRNKKGGAYPPHLHYEIKKTMTNNRGDVIDPFGNKTNRLGRGYKFKSKSTMRPSRQGVKPVGCTGFL
ncbi:M23 family metallopeptidase [bacterium]|nr:M23 family metallopeptidase [bacterium]